MSTDQADKLGPLPAYIYGRETSANERLWTELDMRTERERCYALGVAEERERWRDFSAKVEALEARIRLYEDQAFRVMNERDFGA